MSERTFKAWVTKYALTDGIQQRVMTIKDGNGFAYSKSPFQSFKMGRDCFEDIGEAIGRAEVMKAEKIASLEKQISRLKKLDMAKQVKGMAE